MTFYIRKDNIYAVPVIHYNMETAACVRLAFEEIQPDCVAVELAETMELQLLHAASRLPDISIVMTYDREKQPLYYMCEPCDGAFEGLRSALEHNIRSYCIDLDVDRYPDIREPLPDPYAIYRIGLKEYYEIYKKVEKIPKTKIDTKRELYMARRLKELSFSYERILFVCGMAHIQNILNLVDRKSFPDLIHAHRDTIELSTLSEDSCRDVMAEFGWISKHYEEARSGLDRQKLIYQLYKEAGENYKANTKNEFPGYNLRNLMKFARNYALTTQRLMPDLFQILSVAKGCVDHNYAYETWELASEYPYRKNIDGLPEQDLTIEEMWGHSKIIRFHLREPGRKGPLFQRRRRKDRSQFRFEPPGPFSICSHQPEDIVVEDFGKFLMKKGTQILTEEGARTVPFSTSLEDGIDTRETIRHWPERKLYVKMYGKPPGGTGSIVIIFDEDSPEEEKVYQEKYPWRTTWLGEHEQESDMAFYATPMGQNIVGPGICRCEYGGFMMSYPPRRMFDIWSDPDYQECHSKPEALLMAAIDYSVKPIIVYVASKPPPRYLKSFAQRFGKKVIYLPLGQLSPITVNNIRKFHVLDGHNKRDIADEYIDY